VKRRMSARLWLIRGVLAVAVIAGACGALLTQHIPSAWAATKTATKSAPSVAPVAVRPIVPFNNEGISPDANPTVGNFDGGNRSYSSDALAAAGFAPGQSVTLGNVTFQWMTPVPGSSDNWRYGEQTIPVTTSSGSIALLGASAGGSSTGVGFVRYTDGSARAYTVTFSDWTLDGGGSQVDPSDSVAVVMPYRNTATGKDTVKTYVFETIIALDAGKTVQSVTLPRTVNKGVQHTFAIAAAPGSTSATIKGISNDSNTTSANVDGHGDSYSGNALDAAGLAGGTIASIYGFTQQWPVVAPAVSDAWGTPGAVVPLTGSGSTLEIVGAAVNGASSGTATITYSDNSTQTFTLAFSDWTLAGGAQPLPTNYIVATMSYHNTATGQQQGSTYVFATLVGLRSGKTLQSLTLPPQGSGGQPVVFAAAAGTASTPFNIAAISGDAASATANFDGNGRSYSNNALAAAGLPSGARVIVNNFQFQWPTNATTPPDAWQSSGQIIPVLSNGSSLGFLGAAANGVASGTATITYSDNSTQTFTLAFSDWTLAGGAQPLSSNTIAATMPYRNTATGQQQGSTYVFFTSVALTSGKTAQSVTLPGTVNGGTLGIFAVSGMYVHAKAIATKIAPTYLENPGRTSYTPNETKVTVANASQLHLKWTAHAPQPISGQPIFGNGLVYWGSWDGVMHASDNTGADVWRRNLGQQTVATCIPPTAGVAGAATLGTIGNTAVVYVAGGNNTVYALNAATGAVLWANTLTTSTDYFLWDSPVAFNGSLYIGISSFGDCPLARGKLYRLDLATGTLQNTLVLTTDCAGDSIWGSPTVDTRTGVLFVATGNGCTSDPNSVAIISISTGDLSLIDRWQVPLAQTGGDTDFGSTPTLFTAVVNGVTRQMIGVANKNGFYYALDRTRLSAGPIWSEQFAVGGDCPDCGDGSISPSAWDGATLYVAAGTTTINGTTCDSSVSAINPATGAFVWRDCLTTGPVLGAVLASPGLVFVDSRAAAHVYDASNGNSLFQYQDTTGSSYFYAAPQLANGIFYAANADGNLYAFGL
jgi:outer membrane protein assembly factor BamB